MAKGDRNLGWPGFFRAFTVLCAIMLLLAQEGQGGVAVGSGPWQILSVYEGLTSWTVPALFMLWGMFALEEGKPRLASSMVGPGPSRPSPAGIWGALYAAAAHLLGAVRCPGREYGPLWYPPLRGIPTTTFGCSTPSLASTWFTR